MKLRYTKTIITGLKTPTESKAAAMGRKGSAVPSDRSDRSDDEDAAAEPTNRQQTGGLGAEGSELWEDSDSADLEYCNTMSWGKVSESLIIAQWVVAGSFTL